MTCKSSKKLSPTSNPLRKFWKQNTNVSPTKSDEVRNVIENLVEDIEGLEMRRLVDPERSMVEKAYGGTAVTEQEVGIRIK